jgi:hypothetical protein
MKEHLPKTGAFSPSSRQDIDRKIVLAAAGKSGLFPSKAAQRSALARLEELSCGGRLCHVLAHE